MSTRFGSLDDQRIDPGRRGRPSLGDQQTVARTTLPAACRRRTSSGCGRPKVNETSGTAALTREVDLGGAMVVVIGIDRAERDADARGLGASRSAYVRMASPSTGSPVGREDVHPEVGHAQSPEPGRSGREVRPVSCCRGEEPGCAGRGGGRDQFGVDGPPAIGGEHDRSGQPFRGIAASFARDRWTFPVCHEGRWNGERAACVNEVCRPRAARRLAVALALARDGVWSASPGNSGASAMSAAATSASAAVTGQRDG